MIPYFRFCHISPPYRLSENGNARASRIYRRSHFMSIFLQSDLFINACIGLSRYPYQIYNSARSSSTSLIRLHNGPEAQIFTSFTYITWMLVKISRSFLRRIQSTSKVEAQSTFIIFKGCCHRNLHHTTPSPFGVVIISRPRLVAVR